MNALAGDPESLVRLELEAAERVIRSGWWVLGNEVAGFEQEWSNAVGAEHVVGVANGMDAIQIGLMAMDIGPGDEVITTSMTAFATVLAIIRSGATPVLADIDSDTAMLDPASIERCLSPATRAVIVVHLYGQAGPVESLVGLCGDAGVALIEDCAQAHGAMVGDRSVGSFGDFAAWSFYPTKNLGAIGDAGAISTDAAPLAERSRVLRNYGQAERYSHVEIGLNSRLDELQAAILRARLPYVEDWTSARRATAMAYTTEIRHPIIRLLPLPVVSTRHVHHLFVVQCAQRAQLQQHLLDSEVECLSHYPVPVHMQPPTQHCRRDPAGLPVTERHAAECLSLPCHPYLTKAQVQHVIDAVNAFDPPK